MFHLFVIWFTLCMQMSTSGLMLPMKCLLEYLYSFQCKLGQVWLYVPWRASFFDTDRIFFLKLPTWVQLLTLIIILTLLIFCQDLVKKNGKALNENIYLGGVKTFADGSLGSRSALFYKVISFWIYFDFIVIYAWLIYT